MKHETTPKTNRNLESSLLIIMLCAGLLGILYHMGFNKKGDQNIVMHYETGPSPHSAYIRMEPSAEVGLPVQFALHAADPGADYQLYIGEKDLLDISQTEFEHVFAQAGLYPLQLILRTNEGREVIETYEIEIKEGKNIAAY